MRKVVVLAEAAEDIEEARDFTTGRNRALAIILQIRWWRILRVWRFITEFIPDILVAIGCCPLAFPLAFITEKPVPKPRYSRCWI
jgi:hypothetical protein